MLLDVRLDSREPGLESDPELKVEHLEGALEETSSVRESGPLADGALTVVAVTVVAEAM